ncbi:MAG: hypothetical protein HY754_15700 [Nitrospirae bacterium]|nr:hypothetical protein [Nitrospirota bacterium]
MYRPEFYCNGLIFMHHTNPSEWFIKPIILGQGTYHGEIGEFIIYGNNLPVWMLTVPAMVFLCILAFKKISFEIGVPVIFFFVTYAIFLFVKRPLFIYSSIPLLPFAFTAIAYAIKQLADRYGAKLYYTAMVVMLTWSLYLYPFVTAKRVWVPLYKYILNLSDVKIH